METEHGNVAKICNTHTVVRFSKGMRCVVDHFQIMTVRNLLNLFHITNISVYMDRSDRASLLRDQTFNLLCIHGIIVLINVAENRSQSVTHDGVSRGRKGKRRRDHFALQFQCLDSEFQCHVTVHKQFQTVCLQIICQLCLKRLMVASHICQPGTFPDRLQHFYIFF